jgi:predicted transcriptional regulator of viral defense system
MPRQRSAPFFSDAPVFDRADYARAIGRAPSDKVVSSMLAQHLKAGNIRRIARGVFASVPKHANAETWSVDRFLAASRLRPGGVIAYHSALELQGYAYSESFDLQVVAPGQPGLLAAEGFTCRFIKASAPFGDADLTTVDRLGQSVPATTLECTIADLFDRPDLAGGNDELISSIDLIGRLDPNRLIARLAALGNATAAGAAGWWLERRRDQLGVPTDALDRLQALAPKQNRYALGAASGAGRLAPRWRVILPEAVFDSAFEGLA